MIEWLLVAVLFAFVVVLEIKHVLEVEEAFKEGWNAGYEARKIDEVLGGV